MHKLDSKIFRLALPMILANVTTPLVGLVDTAVLGRLDQPYMLAGASVSGMIITQLIWICGFLRMSSTGLSAQALGSGNTEKTLECLITGLVLSLILAIVFLGFQSPIFELSMVLTQLDELPRLAASDYFFIRTYGFPAALANLVLIGWMIGQQLTRQVMLIQIAGNLLNVILNLVLVYGFNMEVKGVASATVLSEYLMCCAGLFYSIKHQPWVILRSEWFGPARLRFFVSSNTDILLRNLLLQLCISFITIQGARYGIQAVTINVIVMQFFSLASLGLDGIAYAVEALVGEAYGAKKREDLLASVFRGLFWSACVALLYALFFGTMTADIAALLTKHQSIIDSIVNYKTVVVMLPVIGFACFTLDGVAVGLMRTDAMRNTMIISALLGFFPVWAVLKEIGNLSLWIAVLSFLTLRALTLGYVFYKDYVMSKTWIDRDL